jgi:signal transduction histidine kinase
MSSGKPRSRILLAAVLGLELGLLSWGVYVFVGLVTTKGIRAISLGQLLVLLTAMILLYLLYLKMEKRAVEERVVGEKFRTGALLEALPVAAMLLDGDGTILAANPRAAEILGVDELALSGAAVAEAVAGDLGRRLAEGAAGSFLCAAPDGRQLRCTASPVGGAGGAAAVRLVVIEPGAAAGAAQPAAPAARPAPLVGGFLGDVASLLERTGNHLAMLAGAARASSPHEASRAAQLGGVALRLAQAARRIRLAREMELLAAGKLAESLRPEELDCAALVRAVAGRVDSLFSAAGVDLTVEAPGEKLAVKADRERIELVLRDLLEVALAMTSAGGRVTLRAAAGSGEVEVSVTDNGCGMDRGQLDAIFSPDGQPPVQEAYTGGIRDGLQVAREVMQASGGQLWAESAPGRGTRFNLRIPGV